MSNLTLATGVSHYLNALRDELERLDPFAIQRYVDLLLGAWKADRHVFVFGNGGSAATANHHVTDLVKTAGVPGRRRVRAVHIGGDLAMTTAVANDIDYADTIAFPLSVYARPGDLAVAISCSGRSPNVVRAVEWAKLNGLTVAALTGNPAEGVGVLADLHICVPADDYGVIEDVHSAVTHAVAHAVRARLTAEPTHA